MARLNYFNSISNQEDLVNAGRRLCAPKSLAHSGVAGNAAFWAAHDISLHA